ncbi:MAG TPA: type 1 glutamine amidotransferase [Kiritimatiellia bacterium]|nr:type 1 glutamine amidotransferase [Kiritimatiellia bacterium]
MSTGRIACLQHVPFEGPGAFDALLRARGFTVEPTLVPRDGLPTGRFDALLVMGGPMSVNDPDGWIRREREYIREAVARGTPVLGICLGSQLLAAAFGGRVAPGPQPEIGIMPVRCTAAAAQDLLFYRMPPAFDVVEWHGEGITAPEDAVVLAESDRYPVQAFRIGRAGYGLLFHLELEADGLERLCTHCPADLLRSGVTKAQVLAEHKKAAAEMKQRAEWIIDAFADLIRDGRAHPPPG